MKDKRENQICCSDTGTDDFFGPLCVVSCYIDHDDQTWLNSLNIDSIDLSDTQQVIHAGQILKDKLIYSLLLLDNSHYNEMIDEGLKMSQIKTRLYNKAMINVMEKIKTPVDQKIIHWFLSPKKYYKNLKHVTLVVSHLIFEKDHQKYLGLKCAKILSMYAHYQYFRNMNQTLEVSIPHGNNKIANDAGISLIDHYGVTILNRVCKKNMPNYQQILEQIK